ncbi:hypothetical protein LTR51_006812 [Lithohypha guttulata]|nr:hypothetical protein LTR51_006812 [Lithohypha guttulata]
MPDYFYHIGIELFDHSTESPINLSQTFRALNPFTSQQARASRDHKYDSMRTKSSSSSQSPITANVTASSHDDERIDDVVVEVTDDITAGIGTKAASAQTRAAFAATEETDAGERGIVHLYRDVEETPGLYRKSDRITPSELWHGSAPAKARPPASYSSHPPKDEDCTMLAILAVPSYMTPRDFLAFVGPDTRNAVSHFRMVRTSRVNRYMVLMKFKDGRFARQWQSDWNTKLFNTMEPETCHVVFVKSVEVWHNRDVVHPRTRAESVNANGVKTMGHFNKPLAPPTPSLVELPTCPVCLERMDESTGLITNLCQHVFHCTCLEKWSGYGCPVCRFKDDSFNTGITRSIKTKKRLNSHGEYEVDDEDYQCHECHITQSLWQCLICGDVGCGRYAGKHAYRHFEKTGHTFALDLETQRVWDYDRDCYVHRIIANGSSTSDEKLLELPGRRKEGQTTALEDVDQDLDMAKRENLAFEYTQLLTSQLESQRIYFEDQVAKAVDNKIKALQQAEKDAKEVVMARSKVDETVAAEQTLREKCGQLEKDATRYQSKCQKIEAELKDLRKKHEEAKILADTISKNAKTRETEAAAKRNDYFAGQVEQLKTLKEDNATKNFYLESLQEQIKELRLQLAAQTKLQAMVKSGQLTQAELEGATLHAGPSQQQTSLPRKKAHSRSNKQNSQDPRMPQNEPTDEDIEAAAAQGSASTQLGTVAAMLKEKIGSKWTYTEDATEGNIISLGLEKNFLIWKPNGRIVGNPKTAANEIESYLTEADFIEPLALSEFRQAQTKDPVKAMEILRTLVGADYEMAPGKTCDDLREALISTGVLQRKEEEDLYDSDGEGQMVGNSTKSKAKKKKKNKKKK